MVILGCVREVQKMTLGITLPGRLSGRVMVTHISTPYTQLLHSIVDNTEPEVIITICNVLQYLKICTIFCSLGIQNIETIIYSW